MKYLKKFNESVSVEEQEAIDAVTDLFQSIFDEYSFENNGDEFKSTEHRGYVIWTNSNSSFMESENQIALSMLVDKGDDVLSNEEFRKEVDLISKRLTSMGFETSYPKLLGSLNSKWIFIDIYY